MAKVMRSPSHPRKYAIIDLTSDEIRVIESLVRQDVSRWNGDSMRGRIAQGIFAAMQLVWDETEEATDD